MEISKILKYWGLEAGTLVLTENIDYETERESHIWNINNEYILKATNSEEEIKNNTYISTLLLKANIPTQEVITTVDGKNYLMIEDKYYGLFTRIRGKVLKDYFKGNYIKNGFYLGNCLAKLHKGLDIITEELNILGEKKTYIQIGTVMTEDEYRNRGLSRYLIEKIISDYKGKCDCIYLFANDTVLNFYPKFGFEKVNEYQYSISRVKVTTEIRASKLNIDNDEEKQLLESIIDNSIVNSKIYSEDSKNLIMFYCLGFLKENIYYIKEYNAIIICEYEDDVLNINNIFCDRELNLDEVINILMDSRTKKVNLGFTPINTSSYEKKMLDDNNNTLFILKDTENLFRDNYLMFPILSHA